ncbi:MULTISPECIES: hypothetical protein [Sphingomonadaceae]|uniref:hypothetical protein n=1 Tax=Blastomonas fulva TaxID=1550728 RepID=UPI0040349B73
MSSVSSITKTFAQKFSSDAADLYHSAFATNSASGSADDPVYSDKFIRNSFVHRKIILQFVDITESIEVLLDNKFSDDLSPSLNSSSSIISMASEFYCRIETQLESMLQASPDDIEVEHGAISTAITLVDQLKQFNIAPPALSWHGGDAVVMLWALGSTTYAITVTEGEIGYVVRRDRKAVRMEHSIQLESFKLADLR